MNHWRLLIANACHNKNMIISVNLALDQYRNTVSQNGAGAEVILWNVASLWKINENGKSTSHILKIFVKFVQIWKLIISRILLNLWSPGQKQFLHTHSTLETKKSFPWFIALRSEYDSMWTVYVSQCCCIISELLLVSYIQRAGLFDKIG